MHTGSDQPLTFFQRLRALLVNSIEEWINDRAASKDQSEQLYQAVLDAQKALEDFRKSQTLTAEEPAKLQQLRSLSPDAMTREVDFFGFMKAPAVTFLGIANNHGIHHRGQLASYLRAHGSKVPAIYGGSADEPMQAAG